MAFKENLRWDNRESECTLEDVNEEVLKDFLKRAREEGRLSFDFLDVRSSLEKLTLMKNDKLLKAAEILFCDNNPLKVQMAVFALYGIGAGGLWGLLMGRVFEDVITFKTSLIFNIIAGAIIGAIIGLARKLIMHPFYGFSIAIFSSFIGVLVTMDNRGPAYVLIFGPAIGTLLSMLVKHLKNKGILIT